MNKLKTSGRNEVVECCRLIASVLVVFIHCVFPGNLGSAVNCLARIAVPFFFIVSGYFAYGVGAPAMGRRIVSTLKLNVVATGLFALWGIVKVSCDAYGNVGEWLRLMVSPWSLCQWLLLNVNPFSGPLWYLSALLSVLCVFWLVARWQNGTWNYRPLYVLGAVMCMLQILLDSMAKAVGIDIPNYIYRNAMVWGWPMFCMGLFIREHQNRLLDVFGLTKARLLMIIAVGAGVSLMQWFGIGIVEMPVGMYAAAPALLLLAVSLPPVSGGRKWLAALIGTFGRLSTCIYVTHWLWWEVYALFLQVRARSFLRRITGLVTLEEYLKPLIILGLSVLTGAVWIVVQDFVKRKRGK